MLVFVGALYNPDLLQVPLAGSLPAYVADIDRAGVLAPPGGVAVAKFLPDSTGHA